MDEKKPDFLDFSKEGVLFADTLPEDMFLALQKGKIEAVVDALSSVSSSSGLAPQMKDYLEGIRKLLKQTADDLEVLIKAKAGLSG